MKKLIAIGNRALRRMDLTDVALLKICTLSLGVIVGLCAAKRHRKGAGLLAGILFPLTCVPLLVKLFRTAPSTED